MYIVLDYYLNMNNQSKKRNIKYTMIGLLIPMAISLNTEWLFPILNFEFPELIVPALTMALSIIWYYNFKNPKAQYIKRYNDVKREVDALI